MNKYYVYLHRRSSDNKVFYVGKGSGNRAWDLSGRNAFWNRTKNKHGLLVEIVFENLNEDEAFRCEVDTILEMRYFNEPLCNLTSGGEGISGLSFTDEQRLKISESIRGRIPWNKGVKSKTSKKYIRSESVRNKLSNAKMGKYEGNDNPSADLNLYIFVRLSDGFEVECTRSELCRQFNVKRDLIKKLFYKDNPRKSADGWRLKQRI